MANLLSNATKIAVRSDDYTYHTPIDDLGAVGVIGEVQLVDSLGEEILSLGGGGGAGGGDTVYSNASGDFTTAALTGTKSFNVLGPSFAVGAINIALGGLKLISGTAVSDIVTTSISVTGTTGGYVVTVSDQDDNFVGTDLIAANIIGPQRSYDIPLDGTKTLPQITPQGHYIDPVDLISSAQNLTGPFTDVGGEISASSYNAGFLFVNVDINGATGVSFKLLGKHESGGAEEYPLPVGLWTLEDSTDSSTGGFKTLDSDADALYAIPFEINNALPYLQFQVGCDTAGTAGNLGQLDSVVYTLGYK